MSKKSNFKKKSVNSLISQKSKVTSSSNFNSKALAISAISMAACFAGNTTANASGVFLSLPAYESTTDSSQNDLNEFSLKPVLTLWGFTGDKLSGDLQGLIPITGDQNQVFYGIAETSGINNSKEWTADLGFGYRRAISDAEVLGGYLLFDAVSSSSNNRYYVLNPGLESLGENWEMRLNGYLPTNKATASSKQDFADNFGIYDYISFQGHTQYDAILEQYETIGKGADAEIGRSLPFLKGLSLYAGGYYFDFNGAHAKGVDTRLSYELTDHITLEGRDFYDNLNHNTAYFDVKIKFGGFNKEEQKQFGARSKLLSPIEHRYVTIPTHSHYVNVTPPGAFEPVPVPVKSNIGRLSPSAGE